MAKFIITETIPCFVTWTREIEADNQDEAMQKHHDHVGEAATEEIGDSLDGYVGTFTIHEVKE